MVGYGLFNGFNTRELIINLIYFAVLLIPHYNKEMVFV